MIARLREERGTALVEFAIVFPGSTHHFYSEPFVRSDHLTRLLTQMPGTGLDSLREKSDTTLSLSARVPRG